MDSLQTLFGFLLVVTAGSIVAEQICGAHGQHCRGGVWRRWHATEQLYKESTVVDEPCVHPESDIANPVTAVSSLFIAAPVFLVRAAFPKVATIATSLYLALMSFWWHSSLSDLSHSLDVSAFRTLGTAIAVDAAVSVGATPALVLLVPPVAYAGYAVKSKLLYHILFVAVPIALCLAGLVYFGRWRPLYNWKIAGALVFGGVAVAFLEVDSYTTCPASYNWLNLHVYGHFLLGVSLYLFVMGLPTRDTYTALASSSIY